MKVNHVGLVLDRSGSMEKLREEALSGLNDELVEIEKNALENEQRTTITLTTFASTVSEPRRLDLGERVTEKEYRCSGWTALADGIADTIAALQKIETAQDEDVAYLVTIVTDGQENFSKKNTLHDVGVMIRTLEGTGNWTFVFMGCDKNILEVTKILGVTCGNTFKFDKLQYTSDVTSNKVKGIKTFYNARSGGQTQITNFISND